jgi:hypothetical protein
MQKRKRSTAKIDDIVPNPVPKEPKEFFIKEPKESKEPPKDIPAPSIGLEALVGLVTTYTDYNTHQARNLISGVIAPTPEHLVGHVIDWCTHIKTLENQIKMVELVAKGVALVKKEGGSFTLLEHVNENA